MAEFKDRLKELRLANGMSQQELADRLKLHAMTISGYERGVRRPDFETLDSLARLLDADMDYLLGASEKNIGYPRHDQEPKRPIDRNMFNLHFTTPTISKGFEVMRAYEAASPEIQLAVRKLLDLEG